MIYQTPPSPARHSFAASVAPPTPGASGCATCQGGLHLRDELASSSFRDSHRGPRVLPQHFIDELATSPFRDSPRGPRAPSQPSIEPAPRGTGIVPFFDGRSFLPKTAINQVAARAAKSATHARGDDRAHFFQLVERYIFATFFQLQSLSSVV